MSGEASKSSGEFGEKIAEKFLELIGWSSTLRSVSIGCTNSEHKTASGNDKRTHGDDRVFIGNSPFYDSRTDVVHVSVKNNLNGYPEKDADLKRVFKGHLVEINSIIGCAQHDAHLLGMLSEYKKCRRHKEHSGLLIWTSSSRESAFKSIIPILANSKIDEECSENVYVVDGARIQFIFSALQHAKNSYDNYLFYYPDGGGVVEKTDERYGRVLPIELIVADVIPLKVSKGEKDLLVIYADVDFDKEGYKRLISLALGFADAWPREIRIGFRNYNEAHHSNDAASAQLAFSDREKTFTPFRFDGSFLSFLESDR